MKPKREDFNDVQKALALKRREQPPRNYFNTLSRTVHDRLEDPEPLGPRTWPEKLGFGEDWKLIGLCALGLVVCVGLAVALVAALRVEKPDETIVELQADPSVKVYSPEPSPAGSATPPGYQTVPGAESSGGIQPVLVPGSVPSTVLPPNPSATNQVGPPK